MKTVSQESQLYDLCPELLHIVIGFTDLWHENMAFNNYTPSQNFTT